MRIAVRQGVFETNSSSSHSFCIKNNTYDDMVDYTKSVIECLDENGVWDIFSEDFCFGRSPVRLIKTLADKVRYSFSADLTASGLHRHPHHRGSRSWHRTRRSARTGTIRWATG